ncbi:MAG TPA: alpha/beta fold hydrolase [Phycisphaerae bacterium]|nr:alpha/beta fold hydrolase [Phycisphaerae bacterium]
MAGARVWVLALLWWALAVFPARVGAGPAPAPSLAGAWLGRSQLSPVASRRAVFIIQAGPGGSFSGVFVSPDQSPFAIALSRVSLGNGQVTIEVDAVGGRYEGTLNQEGTQMDGRWMQGPASLPLVVQRVEPQEPPKPYPYLEEEVTYSNTADAVTLAGTLTRPPAGGPFPAVILISGSGQSDRDETLFWHRPFLVLADYLTRHGIAVLRVDDRGVGGSTGDVSQATSADFARDVRAGIEYLQTRREIDPRRLGLIGHSDGGSIASLAAVDTNDIAFIVLMAGTGVPGDVVIEGQIVSRLKLAGVDPGVIDATLQAQRRVIDVVKSETDPNRAREKLRDLGCSDAQIQKLLLPWFYFFITHDPQETLRKVKCPVLAINGALDMQVLAAVNLPAIEQALREGGNPDVTVQELPRLNHLFQTAETGWLDEYAWIAETLAPPALETIGTWIEMRTKPK